MPTVLRVAGYRVLIYLPPREHGPPHVHIRHGRGDIVIELSQSADPPKIRRISRMKNQDAVVAFWIVEQHAEFLLRCWRKYHD